MMKTCSECGKEIPEHMNACCSWDCHVASAMKEPNIRVHTPNGLPIRSIKHGISDALLLEHEHGDHPDYKFPVRVQFIGKLSSPEDEPRSDYDETHALVYTDGYVAVTMNECCYAMWTISDGLCAGSANNIWKRNEWQLEHESIEKIKAYVKEH